MDIIKIGTLNTQNSKINRQGGITEDGSDNSMLLATILRNQDIIF